MAVLSDPISDFLTRLKNASLAGNEEFTAPCSNIKVEIARILQEEGYIWNYEVTGEGSKKQIKVKIKFTPQGKPVVTDVKRSSKPGRRRVPCQPVKIDSQAGALERIRSLGQQAADHSRQHVPGSPCGQAVVA